MTRAVASRHTTKTDSQAAAAATTPAYPAGFDFSAEAELFPTRGYKTRRASFGYRRFSRASEAVRFAIEQLPYEALAGAYLEVSERRFDRNGIQQLYNSDGYPLPRKASA